MIHSPATGVKVPSRTAIPFQFIAVPAHLLRAGDLSFGAVVLLGVVDDAARNNRFGLCKLCNATLAARIGRSESEVGRYLVELESAGLVRREFGASRHVRLGVRVTWSEPVPDVPGTTPVQVPTFREPGPRPSGIGVPDVPGPIQNPGPEPHHQTGPILSLEESSEVPDGPTAAAYLRAMIAKGRRQSPAPRVGINSNSGAKPPAVAPPPVFANCEKPARSRSEPAPTPVRGEAAPGSPVPPSGPRYDDPRRQVGVMVDSLAGKLAAGRVGARRLSPAQLQRQLAEVRRRYGAGKSPPRA